MKLQVAGKIKMSTVNGSGFHYTLFLSGCPFGCENCHSPHTQDYKYGEKMDIVDIFNDIYKNRYYIDGVTFSGGEPTEQTEALTVLAKMLKLFDINIWMWSGHTMDKIKDLELLNYIDTIIDGTYEYNNPTEKPFRGSDNQCMWSRIDGKWIKID